MVPRPEHSIGLENRHETTTMAELVSGAKYFRSLFVEIKELIELSFPYEFWVRVDKDIILVLMLQVFTEIHLKGDKWSGSFWIEIIFARKVSQSYYTVISKGLN